MDKLIVGKPHPGLVATIAISLPCETLHIVMLMLSGSGVDLSGKRQPGLGVNFDRYSGRRSNNKLSLTLQLLTLTHHVSGLKS